jgi:Protein of unknown function (DUF3343).
MDYIATFFTHSGAIKYKKFLMGKGIYAELMPVPRRFSSNCGIGSKFSTVMDVKILITIDIEKLYEINGTEEKLIYKEDRS